MKFITLLLLALSAPLAHAFDISAENGTATGNVSVISITNKGSLDECKKSLDNVISALNKANKVIVHTESCAPDGATQLFNAGAVFF